jgi:predicted MFS family arabinose efflux permease
VLIPFGVERLGGSVHTGYLLAGPALRALMDRTAPRTLLAITLTAWAGAVFLLFTSSALAVALPAAVAIGLSGSMGLVIPQTLVQRLIPDALLGRVSAVFLTGEAAATLVGAVTGPLLAQAASVAALAAVAGVVALATAVLADRRVTLDT